MRSIITALVAIGLIAGVGMWFRHSGQLQPVAKQHAAPPAVPDSFGGRERIIYLTPKAERPTLCADNVSASGAGRAGCGAANPRTQQLALRAVGTSTNY